MQEQVIPHGHGLSHKKGISDGLLNQRTYEAEIHHTHQASYQRGIEEGQILRQEVAQRVRPEVVGV